MKPARHLLTQRRFQFRQSSPIERAFKRVRTPFEQFIHDESAGGLLLMGCATIAGVLVAWTIPAKSTFSPAKFADQVQNLMQRYQ